MTGALTLPPPVELGLPQEADRMTWTAWLIAWLTGLDRAMVGQVLTREQASRPDGALLGQRGLAMVESLDTTPRAPSGARPAHMGFMADPNGAGSIDWAGGVFWAASLYDEAWHATPTFADPSFWDAHGRYPAEQSPLMGLKVPPPDVPSSSGIEVPWAHVWAQAWAREQDLALAPKALAGPAGWPVVVPTVDIDNVSAYAGKGIIRFWGAGLRELMKQDGRALGSRLSWWVRRGHRPDPYDHHQALATVLARYQGRVFWLPSGAGRFDRNLPMAHPVSRHALAIYREAGIPISPHPGYETSLKAQELARQINEVSLIGQGEGRAHARYHYLRGRWPEAHYSLVAQGIGHDHTLGYSDKGGYRAGVACPYPAFDPVSDRPTGAWWHPFALMDTHSASDQEASLSAAARRVLVWAKVVGARGLEVVAHNQPIGPGQVPPADLLQTWLDEAGV